MTHHSRVVQISFTQKEQDLLQILDELGIAELKNKYPYMLSGGERQRVPGFVGEHGR